MEVKDLVAYCGLYCGLCDHRTKIPKHAVALIESMERAEYDDWGPSLPDFSEFWRFLKQLAVVDDSRCCRVGKCGEGFCAIKRCTTEKGVRICVECDQYPCKWVTGLAKSEPTLLHDGKRIKEKGLEVWVQEQEERRRLGFCYADVRCLPSGFPKIEGT